ncbi:response regulator [Desulfococcaceae bacterium HSG7]|nr:response regulator [Desulfococcaceae bacterium HSG7]
MDKVLIVDDNQVLIKLITTKLKKYKDRFDVITAGDGEEAIHTLNNHTISLLVTDLNMPKVDGMQLLIYKNRNFPQLPCIIMTAHSTKKIKNRLQHEVVSYIEKKESHYIDELVQAIFNALDEDVPLGTLRGISIASFLQMIEMEQKTCHFEVYSPKKPKGVFYFEEGVLYDAVYGSDRGVDAALKMIQLDSLKINFRKHPSKNYKRRINADLIGLIMEAMRLKDESSEQMDDGSRIKKDEDTSEIEIPVEENSSDRSYFYDFREYIVDTFFDEIKVLKGYRAVGIIAYDGEVLASNVVDNLIDFNNLDIVFNDFLIALDGISQRTGLSQMEESFYITDSGMLVIVSMKSPSDELIYIVSIFDEGGNKGMVRLALKKIANLIRKIQNETK